MLVPGVENKLLKYSYLQTSLAVINHEGIMGGLQEGML